MTRILIADDNEDLRSTLEYSLKRLGFETVTAAHGQEAILALKENSFDIALIDIRMPELSGPEVLKIIKQVSPRTHVMLITAFASLETAIDAVRLKATDYLIKPFSLLELEQKIKNILNQQSVHYETKNSQQTDPKCEFIGISPSIEKIQQLIQKVAPSQASVLITGESGTGKEVLARKIHRLSPRAQKPFVAINCGAIPDNILESELFGYEKGAFTGASNQKKGLLETAHEGTLFLDEIGEMPLQMQVKLLRFLQEHEFQRVGGIQTLQVDVRVIAATNRDLKEEVALKSFREDLLYRLNVFEIAIPPLRKRLEDLPLLVNYCLEKNKKRRGTSLSIHPDVIEAFKKYPWPGNVRELENIIERASVLAENEIIHLEDLPIMIITGTPEKLTIPPLPLNQKEDLNRIEKEMILKALSENDWNQTQAAKQLGMKRSTLQYRMQKFGLIIKEEEPPLLIPHNPSSEAL